MRIAVLVRSFPAISQTFVHDQVVGLREAGMDVDVWAWWPGPAAEPTDAVGVASPTPADDRTRYFGRVPGSVAGRCLRGALVAAGGVLTAPRATIRCLRPSVVGTSARSLRALLEFAPLRPGRRYDAILCHFGPVGRAAVRMRAVGLLEGPIATVFHGSDMSRSIRDGGPDLYAELFRAGELFLPISDRWRARLLELGADPARTIVHRMGVRTDQLLLRHRRRPPGEPLRLVSVARLVEKKGIADAIEAVAALRDRGIQVTYTVAGDGPLRPLLASLVAARGLGETVELLGWCSRARIAELLEQAHLLLAPSVVAADGDEEGIPVVLMEAMATGLPVVATRHSGIPELVEDRVHGRLVAERDPAGIAGAVLDLLDAEDRWPALGDAGRRTVAASFDQRALNARLAEILRSLASDRLRSGA